jgi:hypothetical protein
MQISTNTTATPATTTNAPASATQQLTIAPGQLRTQNLALGQQLAATVTSSNPNGNVSLNINNAQVNARTNLALTEGQLLNLVVTQAGKQTVLKLTDASLHAALLSQALRTNLPKQGSMTDILANMRAITQGSDKAGTMPPLPPAIQQLAKQLVKSLPSERQIGTAEGLKTAIKDSGLFLEGKLNTGKQQGGAQATQPMLKQDFKNQLLQLREGLIEAIRARPPGDDKIEAITQGTITATSTAGGARVPLDKAIIEQIKQLLSQDQDLKAIAKQLPAETRDKFEQVIRQLQNLLPAADSKSGGIDSKGMELLKTLSPQLKSLLDSLLLLPPSPALTSAGKSMGALDALFKQLFADPKASSKGRGGVPMPRAPMQAQAQAGASLMAMNDTQQGLQDMLRQTESALARLQTQQGGNLLEQEAGRLLLNTELPIRRGENIDLLQLRVQEDEKESDKDKFEQGITVTLSLDLEGTGPVYAKVNVKRDTVSVVFWAENEDTLKEASNNIDELETRLNKVGLKPDQLSFLPGKPPPPKDADQYVPEQLLDLKA